MIGLSEQLLPCTARDRAERVVYLDPAVLAVLDADGIGDTVHDHPVIVPELPVRIFGHFRRIPWQLPGACFILSGSAHLVRHCGSPHSVCVLCVTLTIVGNRGGRLQQNLGRTDVHLTHICRLTEHHVHSMIGEHFPVAAGALVRRFLRVKHADLIRGLKQWRKGMFS